jgi:hypothetical protein
MTFFNIFNSTATAKIAVFIFFGILGINTMSIAKTKTEYVTLRLRSDEEEIINKINLDQIKKFILQQGRRCTYSQMYNDNPCYEIGPYLYYLNPDPGGPHNHPQWNINSDREKGDFNTLVIRRNLDVDRSDSAFDDQYRNIDFKEEYGISVIAYYANPNWPISKIREFPEQAVQLLLKFIRK